MADDVRFDGWKAIANALGRERTTAIRWAKERGLPVHRVPGGRTGTVYAIRSELDAWLASDRDYPEPPSPTGDAPASSRVNRHPLGNRPALFALIATCLVVALLAVAFMRKSPANDARVTVAAVATADASRESQDFARGLNADLARFANATPNLAVYEREPGAAPGTQYAVQTEIDRAGDSIVGNARLIAIAKGEVLWSRRFEQSNPSLSALRDQIAANIIGVLRCSFGGLESEAPKATPAILGQLMAICQDFELGDMSDAQARARQLTAAHPDLGLGWAMLGKIQGDLSVDLNDKALRVQALANARRALAIAPDSVCTALALAAANPDGTPSPSALAIVDASLQTHPDHPWLLQMKSVTLFNLGYVKASVAPAMDGIRNDPSSMSGRDIAVRRLAAAGQINEAQQLQAENERLWPDHPRVLTNRARITRDPTGQRRSDALAIAANTRDFVATPSVAYKLAQLSERSGDRRAALEWLARAPVKGAQQQWSLLFWPDVAGLRTEPAFFRKMADLGLVHWWIARKQWPDFCAEPGLKYDCATEARKLAIT